MNTKGTGLQSALSVSGLMHGCLAVSHGMDFSSESKVITLIRVSHRELEESN